MLWLITKYSITALLVVLISELAKRSDKLGGLVYVLVCVTYATDVFGVPPALSKIWFLVRTAVVLPDHHAAVYRAVMDPQ